MDNFSKRLVPAGPGHLDSTAGVVEMPLLLDVDAGGDLTFEGDTVAVMHIGLPPGFGDVDSVGLELTIGDILTIATEFTNLAAAVAPFDSIISGMQDKMLDGEYPSEVLLEAVTDRLTQLRGAGAIDLAQQVRSAQAALQQLDVTRLPADKAGLN